MQTLLLTLLSFFLGALPFSIWVGKYLLGVDIREYGDKNPGATNVLRAGGYPAFILALMLDITKGALPTGLAYFIFGVQDFNIVPIALASPLGHAISPFLNWRGGKSIAAAFGVWIGLTLWEIPVVAITLLVIFSLLIRPSGWAVMFSLAGMLVTLLLWQQDAVFVVVLISHTILLIWNHREDLQQRPTLRLGPQS
ncbi:MAG: glycerol-3-phosphate acyltransferase [Chloroflexota bacterium]